ncbi:MAG: hypothetical protein ABIQ90_03140, partial [Polaromonas sp.]
KPFSSKCLISAAVVMASPCQWRKHKQQSMQHSYPPGLVQKFQKLSIVQVTPLAKQINGGQIPINSSLKGKITNWGHI